MILSAERAMPKCFVALALLVDLMDRFPIIHAIKPGTIPDNHKEKEKKEKIINTNRLIKSYLCSGADSRCVIYRTCECLDACRYGQQYLKQTSEEKK